MHKLCIKRLFSRFCATAVPLIAIWNIDSDIGIFLFRKITKPTRPFYKMGTKLSYVPFNAAFLVGRACAFNEMRSLRLYQILGPKVANNEVYLQMNYVCD